MKEFDYIIIGGGCEGLSLAYELEVYDKLKDKEDVEIDTLESLAWEQNQYSRLGCQVEFKKEYDNMTVTIVHD